LSLNPLAPSLSWKVEKKRAVTGKRAKSKIEERDEV